jgi:bacterioferritin-associated ferredoxin
MYTEIGCVCHNMPYGKIIENINKVCPKTVDEFTSKCDVCKRCRMCLPYIEKYIKEHLNEHNTIL